MFAMEITSFESSSWAPPWGGPEREEGGRGSAVLARGQRQGEQNRVRMRIGARKIAKARRIDKQQRACPAYLAGDQRRARSSNSPTTPAFSSE